MKRYPLLSKYWYMNGKDELAAAERSLYYLWWRYLRLSEDYYWACMFNGQCRDKRIANTYALFNDVFRRQFDIWWSAKAPQLFAMKMAPLKVEILSPLSEMPHPYLEWDDFVLLAVPKFLTTTEILDGVTKALVGHQRAPLPHEIAYTLAASNTRGVNKQVLRKMIDVWGLSQVLLDAKESGELARPGRFTQYWIGDKLNVMSQADKRSIVGLKAQAKHRLAVRVKVNRYLANAKALISNAALGQFPVLKKVGDFHDLWTPEQLAHIRTTLKGRRWISPEIDKEKFQAMLRSE